MNKILVALISSLFAVGAFAASHAGAPMAGASAAAKPAMAAPAAKADAKADAKPAKMTKEEKINDFELNIKKKVH